MKRILTAIICATAALSLCAGNLDRLFDEFKDGGNVEYVKIPRFVMWLTKLGGTDGDRVAKKVTGMKVLTIPDRNSFLGRHLDRRIEEESNGYEELINVKDDGDRVRIFSKVSGNKFKDMYILAADSSECVFVKFSGTFTADDFKDVKID